jgi:hypothetical protein
MDPQPFRFLELPKELRLMVYQHLPRQIKHRPFTAPFGEDQNLSNFALVWRCLPMAILATCRTIFDEAGVIVKRLAREFVTADAPVRLLYVYDHGVFEDTDAPDIVICRLSGGLVGMCDEMRRVARGDGIQMAAPHACSTVYRTSLADTDARALNYVLDTWLPDEIRWVLRRSIHYRNAESSTIQIVSCHQSGEPGTLYRPLVKQDLFVLIYFWETGRVEFSSTAHWPEDSIEGLTATMWLDERTMSQGNCSWTELSGSWEEDWMN